VLTSTPAGVVLAVRVIPRAKKTALGGVRDNALVVRLVAPPVDGAANEALIQFLSTALRIPRRAIHILSGERGRLKRIAIDGVTIDAVRATLTARVDDQST
jgi:uncharacterized protein (TIGR00251 family)